VFAAVVVKVFDAGGASVAFVVRTVFENAEHFWPSGMLAHHFIYFISSVNSIQYHISADCQLRPAELGKL
jgi:hypothetical protein